MTALLLAERYIRLRRDYFRKTGVIRKGRRARLVAMGMVEDIVKDADQHQKTIPLTNVAYCCRKFRTSDLRDHVYALLGLLDGRNMMRRVAVLQVDYTSNPSDVFLRATQLCLETECNWDILSLAGCEVDSHTGNPRPQSWVADFSQGKASLRIALSYYSPIHRAGGEAAMNSNQDYWFLDNAGLIVRALLVDVVARLPNIARPSGKSIGWCRQTRAIAAQVNARDLSPYWKMITACSLLKDEVMEPLKIDQARARPLFERHLLDNKDTASTMSYSEALFSVQQRELCSSAESDATAEFALLISRFSTRRRFAVTESKRFGLVSGVARVGDKICVLPGGKVPFVIREATGIAPPAYELIVECYVEGLMNGEALQMGMELEEIRFI